MRDFGREALRLHSCEIHCKTCTLQKRTQNIVVCVAILKINIFEIKFSGFTFCVVFLVLQLMRLPLSHDMCGFCHPTLGVALFQCFQCSLFLFLLFLMLSFFFSFFVLVFFRFLFFLVLFFLVLFFPLWLCRFL